MDTQGKLACIYSALLLHDDGIAITAEKIKTVLDAADVTYQAHWPGLYARILAKSNVDDLIFNFAAGAAAAAPVAAAAGAAAPAAAAAKKEAPKKEEKKEESDDDMGMGLFD
ncbi:ribosomal acidic phosphoprotein P1 [Heterostelium album PN500]|uniref:Ribosomal acidic phosphoprotein P1 n=1 Tax=Heterostelium pallidum (strain ATCC 26659 / Pp 5 / PN500) TaxID=670386 RepID=D3BDB6_HETP5|nr:ribosomal acidic phosphoprotein P1 [Heterostelium album PN500]EFA80560.1 ribosomal acidic phosphoprotein P1 [Heterostelium album PN500]|eukprot:XP_020432680.1 ribosomal acidic phosphoprotein P1 [Heterostelium album PN500]